MNSTAPDVKSIFGRAAEIASPTERAAYLEEACGGDAQLLAEVNELLAAFEMAGSFMEGPAVARDETEIVQPLLEQPGTIIGPYKLLEQIGEGGMGVVFMAEQTEPIKRRVALKIIKPGMDTRQVSARFEAERQALALMDHPNIARVLDAGTTGNDSSLPPSAFPLPPSLSRPYFVMELVKGVPITDYCDQNRLTVRQRLELFTQVCHAVQHAHQKGIIHRDLKPSNVLVAEYDGRPVPKVIDFGVAKAMAQKLTERTMFTHYGQLIGTFEYMSPEQARFNQLDVDTRSDIYSLGVLLYELLAGSTPLEKERVRSAAFDEILRLISEEDPPKPSTRLNQIARPYWPGSGPSRPGSSPDPGPAKMARLYDSASIAANRHTEPARLTRQLRGELDWIVMKCLEKDRSRRYETASSLASDVEHFLADEPVEACPPSASYRLKKFVRRNKATAAFVGLLLVAVAGLGISNFAVKRERDAKAIALARAQSISDLLQEILASSNPDKVKGSAYTVRELLDDFSAGFGDQLASEPEVEAAIRSVIGKSYWRLGVYDRAELHLKKSLDLRRQLYGNNDERVAETLVDFAWIRFEQNRRQEAEAHVREALSIYKQRKSDARGTVRALWSLQCFLNRQSRLVESEQIANEALALAGDEASSDFAELPNILHDLANAKTTEGKHEEAIKLARRAVEIHSRVHGNHHPETAWGLYNLGRALHGGQNNHEAILPLRKALDVFREYYPSEHPAVQSVSELLRTILMAEGDSDGAAALASEEAGRATRFDNPGYHRRLAEILLTNGSKSGAASDVAHQLIQRAIEEYSQLAIESQNDLDRRLKATDGYIGIGELCAAAPEFAPEVNDAYRRLKTELEGLLVSLPDSTHCQEEVGHRYRLWASAVQYNSNYLSQIEYCYRQAIKLFEKLSGEKPQSLLVWISLADSYARLGDARWRLGRLKDAETTFERAIEIFNEQAAEIERNWKNDDGILGITQDYARIACYLADARRQDQAADFVQKAALNAKRLSDPGYLANGLYVVAVARLRLEDLAGYRDACKALVDVPVDKLNQTVKSRPIWTACLAPDSLDDLNLLVTRAERYLANDSLNHRHHDLALLGAALYRARMYERAAERLEESSGAYHRESRPPDSGFEMKNYQQLLLAMTRWQLKQHDEARQLLAETLPAVDKEIKSPSSSWNRRTTLEILRREAVALIGWDAAVETPNHDKPTSASSDNGSKNRRGKQPTIDDESQNTDN